MGNGTFYLRNLGESKYKNKSTFRDYEDWMEVKKTLSISVTTFLYPKKFRATYNCAWSKSNHQRTRKHSSRLRTFCCSDHPGVSAQGGCLPMPGGVCTGVCVSQHALRQTPTTPPPRGQNS